MSGANSTVSDDWEALIATFGCLFQQSLRIYEEVVGALLKPNHACPSASLSSAMVCQGHLFLGFYGFFPYFKFMRIPNPRVPAWFLLLRCCCCVYVRELCVKTGCHVWGVWTHLCDGMLCVCCIWTQVCRRGAVCWCDIWAHVWRGWAVCVVCGHMCVRVCMFVCRGQKKTSALCLY